MKRVHRNLSKRCYTILGKTTRGWRVEGYADKVCMKDVRCVVSTAGRLRAVRTGHRNVHAFLEGHIISWDTAPTSAVRTRYNPFKHTGFTPEGQTHPAVKAETAWLDETGILMEGIDFYKPSM
jgi:hypothetical protein